MNQNNNAAINTMSPVTTYVLFASIICVILLVFWFIDPIPQDLNYHQFADQSEKFGIPHFWNVVSNIPFLIVGAYGLHHMAKLSNNHHVKTLREVYLFFYCGLILTGLGSAYYHLSPSNSTLVWDRLPMTISFMSFFVFILSCHFGIARANNLLVVMILIGLASVLYWHFTETQGKGDLRPYALVQFFPMILIPLMMLLLPRSLYLHRLIWIIIGLYAMAKLCEFYDQAIYQTLQISGHSLKHFIAAMPGIVFVTLVKRIQY